MVNMLHRKVRVNDASGVSKVVTSTLDKKEDKEQGKLPKNSIIWNCEHFWMKKIRKTKTTRRAIEVNQKVVSNRLREMGKIQKTGRWVPHELNGRQMEKHKNM